MYVKVVLDNAPVFLHWILVWRAIVLETCFKRAQSINSSLEPRRGINSKLYNVIEGAYDIPVCFDRTGRLFGKWANPNAWRVLCWSQSSQLCETLSWNIFGKNQESHLHEFNTFESMVWMLLSDTETIAYHIFVESESWIDKLWYKKQHYGRRLDID